MNLLELLENHTTEESCRTTFRFHRESLGVYCRLCDSKDHRWIEKKSCWHCKKCGTRTSLKSGTVLQHSKMPLKIWFHVVAFMISTKKGYSAKEIQRQTGHKRYEPIWLMMHKIRTSMGENALYFDAFEHLLNEVIDGIRTSDDNAKHLTISKEIQIETLTLYGIDDTGVHNDVKCIRMKSIWSGDEDQTLLIKRRFGVNKTFGAHPETLKSKRKVAPKLKPYFAFKCFSNLKRVIFGIHHHAKTEYLQNYLDEFCYKFNRNSVASDLYSEIWQYLINPKRYSSG